ncbi:thiol-activated cytolysin family protein [Streptomyces sirii]|uniref:thiol-activated cytolysin family protein n=1 Tax=Streptomyces sirii TaxID=3127701 RepID=UPI003D36020D
MADLRDGEQTVDEYFKSLSPWSEISPEVVAGARKGADDKGTSKCESIQSKNISTFPVLSDAKAPWLGQFIQGKSHVAGKFTPLTISERSPINLTIGGVAKEDVAPSATGYASARGEFLKGQGETKFPSNSNYTKASFSSVSEGALRIGLSASHLTGSLEAKLNTRRKSDKSSVLVSYINRAYTAKVDHSGTSASWFKPEMKGADLVQKYENQIGKDNPGLYVDTITYGRSLLYSASSSQTEEDLEASIGGSFSAAGVDVKGNADANWKQNLAKANIAIDTRGGDEKQVLKAITEGTPNSFFEGEAAAGTLVPIEYTVRDIRDNEEASVGETEKGKEDCRYKAGKYSLTIKDVTLSKPLLNGVWDIYGKAEIEGSDIVKFYNRPTSSREEKNLKEGDKITLDPASPKVERQFPLSIADATPFFVKISLWDTRNKADDHHLGDVADVIWPTWGKFKAGATEYKGAGGDGSYTYHYVLKKESESSS